MARYFGDRTAEMLGRLSLNPLRHIDPVGTVLVPGILLATSGVLFGWAKPVPVATKALRNPRLAGIVVALAGPAREFRHGGPMVRRARGHRARRWQRDVDWLDCLHGSGRDRDQRRSRLVQPAAHSAARRRPGARRPVAFAMGRAHGEDRARRFVLWWWACPCSVCSAGCSIPPCAPSGRVISDVMGPAHERSHPKSPGAFRHAAERHAASRAIITARSRIGSSCNTSTNAISSSPTGMRSPPAMRTPPSSRSTCGPWPSTGSPRA